MQEAKWYVAHTYSGYENKVKLDIEKTVINRGLQDYILDVRVPMQSVVEVKGDRTKTSDKKLFPGYVLVHMHLNDETWYIVRNTRGVTGFVGPGSEPLSLSYEEILNLGLTDEVPKTKEEVVCEFEVGDLVVVTSQAFKGTISNVVKVDSAKQKLTINTELFGREQEVELDFSEVKKKD